MKTIDVAAVVVTFNRSKLLIECMSALREQTHSVSKVIIVNNSSTDNTIELLINNGYLDKDYLECSTSHGFSNKNRNYTYRVASKYFDDIQYVYVEIDINSGGAGGFYLGQSIALEYGAEWVWMMDDDGRPSPNCLDLLVNTSAAQNLFVLNPLVINSDGSDRLSFGLSGKIKTVNDAIRFRNHQGLIEGKANPFNGTLINKAVLHDCGLVKSEMFIWGDEAEYFMRLKKARVAYATVVDAKFFHPETKTIYVRAFWGLLKISLKPENLEMNSYRNLGYINSVYKGIGSHRILIKLFLYFLFSFQFEKSLNVVRYYLDGVRDDFVLPHFLKK